METLADGKKVFVTHFRRFRTENGTTLKYLMTKWDALSEEENLVPLPTGGSTEAIVVDEKGNWLAQAFANCSKKDHYNKRIGRDIAIGRAMKKLKEVSSA